MKKLWALALCAALLTGCAARTDAPDSGRLQIVTTLFPYYDFARAVAGDAADVTLLLSPGREAHSFEPTPLDAVTVARADVFLCNGGESEQWADELLSAVGGVPIVVRLMDAVEALDEEYVEGMQGADREHGHDHEQEEDAEEIEYDEHVWTSPENAITLCESICGALCAADAAHEAEYRANCEDYCAQLRALDGRFRDLRSRAARGLLIFADRMPMLYFCRAYDLEYRAAFHGCASDTEPSLATLKYLIDKVSEERIPMVYTIDLDSDRIARVVRECTGAEIGRIYSLQTVSRADFDAGETYLTLMERNLKALEGGLL